MLKKILALALLSLSCVNANDTAVKQVPEKLFAKADFSDCQNIYPHGEAKLVDNEVRLISSGGNWFFLTKKKYKDFILEAEVKMPEVEEYSNSGILFRAQIKGDIKGKQTAIGYQAEVDSTNRKWSGGLYDQGRRAWLHPAKSDFKATPEFKKNMSPEWTSERGNAYRHLEWNKYRIECRGSDIKIYLNDILTTHVIDTKDAEGYIGIQHHGSAKFKETGDQSNTIQFRNINITELKLTANPCG